MQLERCLSWRPLQSTCAWALPHCAHPTAAAGLLLDAPLAAAASRPTPAVVVLRPQLRQPEQQRRLPDFEVDSSNIPAAAPQPAAARSRLVGSGPETALRPAAGPMAGHASRTKNSHRDADLPADYNFLTDRVIMADGASQSEPAPAQERLGSAASSVQDQLAACVEDGTATPALPYTVDDFLHRNPTRCLS